MAVDRTVELDEVDLVITEAGVGGHPLLLLHGFTGARTDFTAWLDPLASAGWHAVAPDHRGHGDSTKPPDEDSYSFELFATDALALASRLGWDRFTLLGHSMGGMIAQTMTLRAGDRISALVLMDTSHKTLAADPELVALGVTTARSDGLDVIADLLATVEGPLETEAHRRTCEADPEYAAQGDRNLRVSSPAMYARMLTLMTSPGDRLDELARGVRCPTLVMVGDQDQPFIRASERMAHAIAGARLVVIPDAGHCPQFESPAAWWEALSSFLAEVAPPASTGSPPAEGSGAG